MTFALEIFLYGDIEDCLRFRASDWAAAKIKASGWLEDGNEAILTDINSGTSINLEMVGEDLIEVE